MWSVGLCVGRHHDPGIPQVQSIGSPGHLAFHSKALQPRVLLEASTDLQPSGPDGQTVLSGLRDQDMKVPEALL